MTFLNNVFSAQFPPEKIGVKSTSELRTLATALDNIATGDLATLADLLAQRFKAIQASIVDGNWSTARRLELVPSEHILASPLERRAAMKEELLHAKIREASKKG